ncbi:MAG TPA: hypothetical protein VK788_23310 [Terriglobales bacterium]|jgi:hypothetical protein|nr:hypothetical protein [Terriglobales bacterium]
MRSLKLASVSALFVVAVSLSAFANSNNDSFSNVNLTGVSGTVSGSFVFNSTSDTFSNISLLFNGGVFNGGSASDGGGKATCLLGLCGFSWQAQASDGAWVTDSIIVNLKTGQFLDLGGVYQGRNDGDFKYLSVPEGGTPMPYLLLSGFAILVGILISGKRRRILRTVYPS